jgi:hypothetical protein
LKVLYDLDAIYPEAILEWNEGTDNQELKKLMEPFVAWLEEDDEEEDEEDED